MPPYTQTKATKNSGGMDKTFKITINLLTEKVKENLAKIKDNQKEIRDLEAKQNSKIEEQKLKKKISVNNKLLTENIDLIKVQLGITSLLEKTENAEYLENDKGSEVIFRDVNDCLEHTMEGFLISNTSGCFSFSEEKVLALS